MNTVDLKDQTRSDLRISGMTAGYGPIVVCRDISLHVPPGTVMALLGPNGAGKTTLVRALAGLIRAQGSMHLGDTDLSGMSAHARARNGLTTMTDDRGLFRELTVAENLQLGASLGKASLKNPMRLVEQFPAIAERGDTKAGLLSGGEQQMLAIAKALASDPRVLVLDEPSQGLAPSIVAEVGVVLKALKQRQLSVLIAEQNLDLVSGISDRYAVLAGGRIVDEGPIEQLDRDGVARHFLSGEIS